MNISKLLNHKYFKFGIVVFIYILFVIWLKNYWFLGKHIVYWALQALAKQHY